VTDDAPSFEALLTKLIAYLEFESPEPGVFMGRYGGYPMALSILPGTDEHPMASLAPVPNRIDPPGQYARCGLLFQIRHVREEAGPAPETFDWGEEISDLIEEGVAKVDTTETSTWFSLYDPYLILRFGLVTVLLDNVLVELERTGHDGCGDTCHYCHHQSVSSLTYDNGRVGQMCEACLAPYMSDRATALTATRRSLFASWVLGVPGALVGAIVWSTCWFLSDMVFGFLTRHEIEVIPNLILLGFAVAAATATGVVVAAFIRLVHHRGDKSGALTGLVFSSAAVALGEAAHLVILSVRYDAPELTQSLGYFYVKYWTAVGGLYALAHFAAVIGAIAVATARSRAQAKPIPL